MNVPHVESSWLQPRGSCLFNQSKDTDRPIAIIQNHTNVKAWELDWNKTLFKSSNEKYRTSKHCLREDMKHVYDADPPFARVGEV